MHRASNRLNSGEVTDFYEGMRLMRAEFEEECGNDEDDIEFRKRAQHVSIATYKAQSVYKQCMDEALLKAVDLMRVRAEQDNDDDLAWISNAVESGDYSQLAI